MSREHLARGRTAIVPIWLGLLTLAVYLPVLGGGYVLTYDMVWVPHLDLQRSELWGLDSALPRAVPSDAFVALLGAVIPAAVVQKLLLVGAMVMAGLGADQLVKSRPLLARLATVTFAVWNPFVAERLLLGQWPLLVAYAGLFWLVAALCSDAGQRWSTITLALAATALTPATGLMGVVVGVIAGWRRGSARVVIIATALNLPWLVASLLQPGLGKSDPSAVPLFDVTDEGSFGRLGSALTLGGIWNSDVVPTSRTLGLAVIVGIAMGIVMVVGLVVLFRTERRLAFVLTVVGALGLAIALSGWLFPDAVVWVIEEVPGGGIIRDGTRWLGLLALLESVALGAGVCGLVESRAGSWRVPAAALLVSLPLVAMPDFAWGVGGALKSAEYPEVWDQARRVVTASEAPGDLVALPFSAYRAPEWNRGRTVIDPAGRYFDRTTVRNDDLVVGGVTIEGEDPRAAAVQRALRSRNPEQRLARWGIGLAVVDTQAPQAADALRSLASARELPLAAEGLRVFEIPGATPEPITTEDRRSMIVAWSVAGLALLLGVVGQLRRSASRLQGQAAKHRTRQVPQA